MAEAGALSQRAALVRESPMSLGNPRSLSVPQRCSLKPCTTIPSSNQTRSIHTSRASSSEKGMQLQRKLDGTFSSRTQSTAGTFHEQRQGRSGAGVVRATSASETGGKQLGFFSRLGRVLKEKAESDFNRVFKGVSKTRENLAVIDELLTYWNLNEADSILEELEEALIVADFGPRTAIRIVDDIRGDITAGKLKTGPEIRAALKASIVKLLTSCKAPRELQLSTGRPSVIMIVGVNGGGKTTTIGKLAHRFSKDGAKVLLAAGDTFRAAAREQLSVWAERTGAEFYGEGGEGEKARPASVLANAVRKAQEDGIDILLADTSGRLHTNYNLMEELKACKRAVAKALPSAPHEVIMVLDGTTGLNMLPQAKEFNETVGVTGFVLSKLDGTARGGCVASVVDTLGIPVKFVGVGEGLEDLQPFDPESFVDALFPS